MRTQQKLFHQFCSDFNFHQNLQIMTEIPTQCRDNGAWVESEDIFTESVIKEPSMPYFFCVDQCRHVAVAPVDGVEADDVGELHDE